RTGARRARPARRTRHLASFARACCGGVARRAVEGNAGCGEKPLSGSPGREKIARRGGGRKLSGAVGGAGGAEKPDLSQPGRGRSGTQGVLFSGTPAAA